ncbi:hypothetical protein ASZ90_003170 [hydrocarbon metagenome]|uniref:Antitoxin n=1 Tax=hydrocarbon metagenome TaxID=938273 RepID=A0A0W8G1R2_9ZZZZ
MVERINIDPNICHGKPVIKGTRVLVSNILSELSLGKSFDEIIENYPNITKEDIEAALNFGSYLSNYETFPYDVKTP